MNNPKIRYYENGKISSEFYYLNDKYHRTEGPAIIQYYENGKIRSEDYYIEGQEYPKLEYTKLINDIKQLPEGVRLTDKRGWVRELWAILKYTTTKMVR